MTKSDVTSAIQNAHKAYLEWREDSFDYRKGILLRAAEIFRKDIRQLAELITLEMGKRIEESRAEIKFCADILEYYANNAEDFLSDHELPVEDAHATIHYKPLGVLLGVMPWNFPFYQVVRFIAPNLMSGNTVLVRHASNVPQCAEKMELILREAGLPDHVFTNLVIPHDFVKAVIESEHVRGVSLTGGEAAGSSVASLAGAELKPSVMELGGNDPFIVLDDVDIESVVEMAVKGRMVNTGQSCVGSKRFIVLEAVAEPFIAGFKQALSNLKMGDPLDEDVEVGPLSTEEAAQGLYDKVQLAINSGAKVVLGGDRPDLEGAYFNPTILTEVNENAPTFDVELFGPVATIYIVKDEKEAIKLANNSSYGLGGSVYTNDVERGRKVAREVETGMMFVNQPTNSQVDLPFGGIKRSGYGTELSKLGIMEFVNKQLVHSMKI